MKCLLRRNLLIWQDRQTYIMSDDSLEKILLSKYIIVWNFYKAYWIETDQSKISLASYKTCFCIYILDHYWQVSDFLVNTKKLF